MAFWILGLLAVMSAGTSAAEVGLRELFDGSNKPRGRDALVAAHLARSGPGAALRHIRVFPKAIDETKKRLQSADKLYQRLGDKWWGWRIKFERNYVRKHKRPPAEYPTPDGINRSYLASERALKVARNGLFQERLFQQRVLSAIGQALKRDAGEKSVAGLRAALSARDPLTRTRAARMLVHLDGAQAATIATEALAREKSGAVLSFLLRFAPSDVAQPFLIHPSWVVRAAAASRVKDQAVLARRAAVERGFVRGELDKALGAPPSETIEWFGRKVNSRAVVFCVEATAAAPWPAIQQRVAAALAQLKDGAVFGLVAMGRETHVFKRKLVVVNAGSRDAAKKFLAKLQPAGVADVYRGLELSLDLAGGGGGGRPPAADTLLLLTIRLPHEPQNERNRIRFSNPRQIATEIEPMNAIRGVRIHSFGPTGDGDADYLKKITSPQGGSHRSPAR